MDEPEDVTSIFLEGKKTLDVRKVEKEMVGAAKKLVNNHPDIGALVMECTNMPPCARVVQDAVGLPVFDATTMIRHIYESLHRQRFNS
jgi:Asp/Glu/hydantoin racemase